MSDATNPPPVVEFIEARLRERDEYAKRHSYRVALVRDAVSGTGDLSDDLEGQYIAADVAAKRAILAIHEIYVEEKSDSPNIKYSDAWKPDVGCVNCDWDNDCRAIEDNGYPCDTVRLLAQPFAGHSDYRPEWKVPR